MSVRPLDDVIREASSGLGYTLLTIASFDYAEGAFVWYNSLAAAGLQGMVVVAMDLGAYSYLVNRNVPVVYVPTIAPLNPCCLRTFKMTPWRATNDVKVSPTEPCVAFL